MTVALPGIAAGGEISTRDVTVKVHVTKAPAGARDLRLFRNGSLVKDLARRRNAGRQLRGHGADRGGQNIDGLSLLAI